MFAAAVIAGYKGGEWMLLQEHHNQTGLTSWTTKLTWHNNLLSKETAQDQRRSC